MKINTGQIFQKKIKQLLESWMMQQLNEEGLREDLITNQELRQQSEELLQSIVNLLKKETEDFTPTSEYENLSEIVAGISTSRAINGFTPTETGYYIFSLKQVFSETIEKEIKELPVLYAEMKKINKLMDNIGILSFENFIRGREDVILRQTNEISEISTPVIRVWDGILALPIIGTLDSARTQVVMESLLMKIVETESTIAILDISGVPAVDSLVAQHLIKTVSATRLMGAECIISGIRPEIAQTIVHLGIDLSGINTKASLAHALRTAFNMLKLEVKKQEKRLNVL
ncbi:MAG: STAS domain-containing protein [Bacteroidota bacterium]